MTDPVAPQSAPPSRTTIAPPKQNPAALMTPGQLLADNFATRLREIVALTCYVMLARWGLLPGQWAAGLIAATVLPIEITRQVAKGLVGRAAAITGGGGAAAVAFAVVSKVHSALTIGPIAAALIASIASCSGTQVQQEMRAADTLGLAANRAAPVWLNAMRIDGEHAADAQCTDTTDDACVRRRLDAVHAVVDRWVRVRDQWEIARVAHDAYATCLEAANRADGGVCPDPEARRAALSTAILAFRCELRAVGHPEADPLGAGVQCPSDSSSAPGGAQ